MSQVNKRRKTEPSEQKSDQPELSSKIKNALDELKNSFAREFQDKSWDDFCDRNHQHFVESLQRVPSENLAQVVVNAILHSNIRAILEKESHTETRKTLELEKESHTETRKTLEAQGIIGLLDLVDSSELEIISKGTKSSHVYCKNHKPATHETKKFDVSPVPRDAGDWIGKGLAKKWTVASNLLALRKKDDLEYANESDLQSIVQNAIVDAVYICNELIAASTPPHQNKKRLKCRRDASLLSTNKPDHTVIFEETSGIDILTVEDKKPFKNIEEKSQVLGQLCDFLSKLQAFGHPNAFGVLTTFEKTWVGWIDKKDEAIASQKDRFALEKVRKVAEGLGNYVDATPSPPSKVSPTVSPPRLRDEGHLHPQPAQGYSVKEIKRTVFLSEEAYEAHQLVPVLCNAIFCGLQNLKGQREILDLQKYSGKTLSRHFLKFTRDSYEWVDACVPQIRGKSATNVPNKPEVYLAFEVLGVGETSRAFRAVTEDGYDCVIKMYVRKYVDNNPLSAKEFKLNAKASVKKEVEWYKKIYDNLSGHVWQTIVNGFHCVVHPYFESIGKGDRTDSVGKIKDVLEEKFRPHQCGFAESDRLWRHVGMYKGDIYLFDLADLEQVRLNEYDAYIKKHCEVLGAKVQQSSPLAASPSAG